MKKPTVLACLMLLTARLVAGADDNPAAPVDAKRLNRELPGTWECVSFVDAPKQISHIKHVTPTHFTWVTHDRDQKAILAAAGGTWSLRNGEYVEDCQFTTDNFPQARGNSYPFEYRIDGDRWILKGGFNRAIRDDEAWTRLKKPNP